VTKIFCALDMVDVTESIALAEQLRGICGIKIGLEFFNANGPQGVRDVMQAVNDIPVFLDLKYHDIPNTVAGAIRSVTDHVQPAFLNVHAAGGLEMMRAARDACPPETQLLAVTVLTSIDPETLQSIGQGQSPEDQVKRLAALTKEAGLDGVVCSSREIKLVRETCGDDFITMVPGIRPAGAATHDQKRVMTPAEAVAKGATYLVIGRPITQSDDPAQAAKDIMATLP